MSLPPLGFKVIVKLAEALSIVNKAPADAVAFEVLLACGFTPLHLENYLAAHLQKTMPGRKVRVRTGLYGDLTGTLEQFGATGAQACALAIEWPDLDPRLGFRQLGGWGTRVETSILECVGVKLQQFEAAIASVPAFSKLAVSLPTLPLPPAFHTIGWQASEAELALENAVTGFAHRIAVHPFVLLVNRQKLDTISAPEFRYDFRSDLHTGFPYTMAHADALGAAFAALIDCPPPKKGLITDLDDTLWSGLIGEVGPENVLWDLSSHSQLHGLYQQMLRALADQGVLIAIASKNSPEVVDKGLSRSDLLIPRDKIYPLEVHWEPKSGSVARILKTWNIGDDSVVFVDDSPMELEEVRAAHPGIECLLFPKSDYAAGLLFLRHLRELFGKSRLSDEDSYRLLSIRQNQQLANTNGAGASAEQFLASAEASVTLEYNPPVSDARVIELVNKTNQFNLNGVRYTPAEWQAALREPYSFSLAVSYQDKFGPLGKVAILRGRRKGTSVHLETWVMSCRAFSRRIEFQCLAQLFERFDGEELVFHFKPTPKNGPIQDFLTAMLDGPLDEKPSLKREVFEAKCPKLYQTIIEKHG